MADPSADSIDILLAEDNPGGVRLIREAFDTTPFDVTFHVVTDGSEAIETLGARDGGAAVCPDLVLLDLNLPQVDGFGVLEAIRADSAISALPVLVLSSSRDRADVARSYELAANAYLAKPGSPEEFETLVRAVEEFWFEEAHLPPVPT